MSQASLSTRLDRAVDDARDHVLGPRAAPITLVEYGSYACPHCRAANDRIAEIRDQFGERLRYVFRHRPITGSDLARRAAELAESCEPERFWDVHIALMTRSETLTEEDLQVVARDLGDASFSLSLRHWINDGLLTIFFLVVGLEIKREFTVGHLASRRSAALPIAGAIGGMAVPALLYLLVIPAGPLAQGWGVPMATDTAFAVALVVMLGHRVPIELRIFLTAAAIVDDIGAIIVVAIFYSGDLDLGWLAVAAGLTVTLALLNRAGVYRAWPYAVVGLALWAAVHEGGLHATLAGVVLALFTPTRPPADLRTLIAQANSIVQAESQAGDSVLRHGPSLPALRALDAIHDRLESPADRTLRHIEPWSSYVVLPVFALANAGVALSFGVVESHSLLAAAIVLGLFIGKPVGLVLAAWLAVRAGLAVKPADYSWGQLVGAGALAGIGFTMSLFIAGQAFPGPADFDAAKIAVFAASVLSALAGVAVLWGLGRREEAA